MLFIIIFVLTLAFGFISSWWFAAIIAFAAALYAGRTGPQAFWSGFGAVFAVWIVLILFKTVPNDHILASRVAVLFHLSSWILLMFITALIGGLVAGTAALSGVMVKRVFEKAK